MKPALAVLFAACVAVGAGMVYLPAFFIVGGVEGLAGVYVSAYMEARREAA